MICRTNEQKTSTQCWSTDSHTYFAKFLSVDFFRWQFISQGVRGASVSAVVSLKVHIIHQREDKINLPIKELHLWTHSLYLYPGLLSKWRSRHGRHVEGKTIFSLKKWFGDFWTIVQLNWTAKASGTNYPRKSEEYQTT